MRSSRLSLQFDSVATGYEEGYVAAIQQVRDEYPELVGFDGEPFMPDAEGHARAVADAIRGQAAR